MIAVLVHPSPVGPLTLVSRADAVSQIRFESQKYGKAPVATQKSSKALDAARRQLDAYFAGKLQEFDLPLAPEGTDFQLRVWKALEAIPFGETRSYGAIAAEIGARKAVRAVGAANGRNPIPIVVPCHRVIGANGSLTGFGGGMERKEQLLRLEGALL
jgi:methylated-DNA-[protein]-cysteine S-methyltransferase